MCCNFTLKHYEEICKIIIHSKYKLCFFNDDIQSSRFIVVLRHDIDQSIEQALRIAKIENNYNIKSTFFLWLRSPFYNIFEKKYTDIIYNIIELGHQIGLHFDESVYKIENEKDLNKFIEKEINLVKIYFSVNIYAVSMHKPSKTLLNSDVKLDKYINTYEKKFFRDLKYISDSRRTWKEGCVCKKLNPEIYPKLHLLIHPFWWVEKEISFSKRIVNFIEEKKNKTILDISSNISRAKRLLKNYNVL